MRERFVYYKFCYDKRTLKQLGFDYNFYRIAFIEKKIKRAISRLSNRIQDQCVIRLLNGDMEKGGGCKDWSIMVQFLGNNIISQDPAHLLKNKTRKSQTKARFHGKFAHEHTKVSIHAKHLVTLTKTVIS